MSKKPSYNQLEKRVHELERAVLTNNEHMEELKKYRNIVSSTSDGIAFLDTSYRYILVNDAYEQFSGRNREHFIGLTVSEYLGQEVFEQHIQPNFDRCLHGEIINYQASFTYPTLGKRFVDVTYFPYRDDHNHITGVIANTRDITDRQQIEEHVRFQAHLLDSVAQAVMATDPTGTIIYWNAYAKTLYGWSAKDVVGKNILDVNIPQIAAVQAQEIMVHLKNGKSWHGEFWVQHKDGRTFPIDVTDSPVYNADGELIALIGISSDITERKQAEERLKSSLAEKEILLRELYHRTKNTLQVIRSMLFLQAATMPENDQVQKLVNDMEHRIMAMALVHQHLYQSHDLSRISMQEYVHELAHLIMQSYATTEQNISLIIDVEPLSMLLDTAIPCGLILNELLSNSLKYAFPDGQHGQIVIRLQRNDTEHIELWVADNGVGVPKEFDVRDQRTLGLQTVIAIAEHQMQGTVKFIRKPQGVAWTVEFPTTLYSERV